jgi:hypothetical protein
MSHVLLVLLCCRFDPSHIPFAHHGIMGTASWQYIESCAVVWCFRVAGLTPATSRLRTTASWALPAGNTLSHVLLSGVFVLQV